MINFQSRILAASTATLLFLVSATGCSEDSNTPVDPDPVPVPEEITIAGVGPHGIFDPSLAHDPVTGLLWMSYSEVIDSVMWPEQNMPVQSRLAWSDDGGDTWTDSGSVINPALDVVLPLDPPNNAGTWVQEVPALVLDPGAVASERWKLVWMNYLQINKTPVFVHGWLGLKTASSPEGPWSSERKLFAGSLYDTVNDVTIGPPEVYVNLLAPELAGVAIVAEPGLLATDDALYAVMFAMDADLVTEKIILIKLEHAGGSWEYLGTFLNNNVDALLFGFEGFNAPELFVQDGTIYLTVTPHSEDFYRGTMVFEVSDLEIASLSRVDGIPTLALEIYGTAGTHNGAAGYHEEATASGLIYSEVDVSQQPLLFRIFKSGETP